MSYMQPTGNELQIITQCANFIAPLFKMKIKNEAHSKPLYEFCWNTRISESELEFWLETFRNYETKALILIESNVVTG